MALITAWGFALAVSGACSFALNLLLSESFTIQKPGVLVWQFAAVAIISGVLLQNYLAPKEELVTSHGVVKYISTDYMDSGGFVAKPSPWLQHNLAYAVVLEEEEGFERIIGMAKVVMTQDNKLIQLMVVARLDKASTVWTRLDEGETNQIKSIKLKMGVPHE